MLCVSKKKTRKIRKIIKKEQNMKAIQNRDTVGLFHNRCFKFFYFLWAVLIIFMLHNNKIWNIEFQYK